jgi:hypothetical protein
MKGGASSSSTGSAGGGSSSGMNAAQQQQAQNAMARQAILQNAVERIQQVYSTTQTSLTSSNNVINIVPRNVGLIKGFFVEVAVNVTLTSAAVVANTPFGAANLIQQVIFNDLQNNTRIQTAGWHLHSVNTARIGQPYGIPYAMDKGSAGTNQPVAYGDNWGIQVLPTTLTESTATTLIFRYYVPLAYSKQDLRGAVYANVINATMQLQITLNTNLMVTNTADPTLAVYAATTATAPTYTINSAEIIVYQHYLDQLPMGQNGPILPWLDLSTSYELKNTSLTGLAAGQDFPIPYSNYRSYLSTFFVYDNGGTLNFGSDINYISLQSANYTNLKKMTPDEWALLTYLFFATGLPKGTYYLSHRDDPISTIQYGNMDLIINPSTVNTGAQVLVGYEDMAMINLLNNAQSLPGG